MVDVSTHEVFGSNLDSRPPSLRAESRRDPGGKHENEDPEPSGQGRSPRPCSRWRCLATDGGGMNLRPSCPHKAGMTAGSGQKARPRAGASMGAATPSLRAEAMPRLSPRVDAGSRRAGNPRYQHGHRRVAARRPPRAGAGPSSEALPTGGQGRGHTTGPGCRQRQAQRRRFAMASR